MGEIKALTSLRGIAALLVLAFHLHLVAPATVPSLLGIITRGYLGVDFFFLLSGTVLARSYGHRFEQGFRWSEYLRFIILRFGRIFPLHLTVLAAFVVTEFIAGRPYEFSQIFGEATLVHRWGFIPAPSLGINKPDWSISVEWAANLLFPLFVVATLRPGRGVGVMLAAAAFAALIALAASNAGSLDLTGANSYAPLTRCFLEFGLGMLLYRLRSQPKHIDIMIGIALAGLVVAFAVHAPDPVMLPPIAVIIFALLADEGFLCDLLKMKPLHWLGELSFSIYLVHFPILAAIKASGLSDIKFVVAVVASCITVSIFTFHFIEVKWRDRSKDWARSSLRWSGDERVFRRH